MKFLFRLMVAVAIGLFVYLLFLMEFVADDRHAIDFFFQSDKFFNSIDVYWFEIENFFAKTFGLVAGFCVFTLWIDE